jgi:pyridoxine 4-dehydrogenase
MKRALELGANLWNAGDFYGPPHANSLQLLDYYFTKYPEDAKKVVLSIKSGMGPKGPDGSPEGIRASLDNCLKVLDGKVAIDVFEPARVDLNVPIETTVAALADYVKAGKIGGIGLSEVNADTLRRAHAVHPIAAVEVELSLFSTDPLENGIAETAAELNIPVIAYSPLSRGFLTGQINSLDDLPANDSRRNFPRFQPDVFDLNVKLVNELKSIATRDSVTLPQAAIAWVLAQNKVPGAPVIVPIPGATTIPRVEENLKQVELSDSDLDQINKVLKDIPVHGDRYGGVYARFMNL